MIAWTCPCSAELEAPDDFAGRTIQCPSCNTPLMVPAPKTAPPERPTAQAASAHRPTTAPRSAPPRLPPAESPPVQQSPSNEERKKAKALEKHRRTFQQLRITGHGLTLIWLGMLIFMLVTLFHFMTAGIAAIESRGQAPFSMDQTMKIGIVLGCHAVSDVFKFIGAVLCCWVPARAKAKKYAILSLMLFVGVLVCIAAAFVILLTITSTQLRPDPIMVRALLWADGIAVGLAGIATLFFLLFLRNLAKFIDIEGTANDVMAIYYRGIIIGIPWAIIGGIAFVLLEVAVFAMMASNRSMIFGLVAMGSAMVLIVGCIMFWVVLWIQLFFVVDRIRKRIREGLAAVC